MDYSKNIFQIDIATNLEEVGYDLAHVFYSNRSVVFFRGDFEDYRQQLLQIISACLNCNPPYSYKENKQILKSVINDEPRELIYINLLDFNAEESERIFNYSEIKNNPQNIYIINEPDAEIISQLTDPIRLDFFRNGSRVFLVVPVKLKYDLQKMSKLRNGLPSILDKLQLNHVGNYHYAQGKKVVTNKHAIDRARQIETISRKIRSDEAKLRSFLLKALKSSKERTISESLYQYKLKKYGDQAKHTKYFHNDQYNITFTVRQERRKDRVITVYGDRLSIPYPLEKN